MQIGQLEHYGVPVWSVSPLTKNLLVSIATHIHDLLCLIGNRNMGRSLRSIGGREPAEHS